ncbi:flagellar rod assembly protein/muramidase FlgJ [Caballeronia calidae]|uniref:Flagellar rod assembly protein/muramidase FlgJ n=2 Tax=Caballeronia calidae TaxID=1777139 RepID=A0A158A7E3_9BURK|nr:flagellar rod assembly protein/muramidase FlgJ [Caballeronia calidae]
MLSTEIPASFTVSQAALESAWGAHCPGFNLFGIKADPSWKGLFTSQVTNEVVNGKTIKITAKFRAYSDWLGSIDDHAQFLLTNPRYKSAFAYTSGATFAKAIQACGYATDPQYAQKIIAIIRAHNLSVLDITASS